MIGRKIVEEAANWLESLLIEEGEQVDRKQVMRGTAAMGFKERTVYRVCKILELEIVQMGFDKEKCNVWKLPDALNLANPKSWQIWVGRHDRE